MIRALSAAALSLALCSSSTYAQDGPLNRVGRALDQTGRNIRTTVEDGVARGQTTAQEHEVLNRLSKRINWDKKLVGSSLRVEVRPGGVVILQGSVLTDAARLRTVDLVESTMGVSRVVDELAVVRDVKVIDASPAVTRVEPRLEAPVSEKAILRP